MKRKENAGIYCTLTTLQAKDKWKNSSVDNYFGDFFTTTPHIKTGFLKASFETKMIRNGIVLHTCVFPHIIKKRTNITA